MNKQDLDRHITGNYGEDYFKEERRAKLETPEWVAEVHREWTTLQILELGIAFAFNRETGRVYKLPSDECPFIQCSWPNAALTGAPETKER